MPTEELAQDLDNCLINFDRKVLVTNLLDKYGGDLEQIAKTVNEFLSAEEAKGKKFEKIFFLRGVQTDSQNEVVTIVPEEKLEEREKQLTHTHSMLYSAETAGGVKMPTEFVPLKHMSIKLDSLEVMESLVPMQNGTKPDEVKVDKQPEKKSGGALGAMFKKQETAAASKKSPEKAAPKKTEPEKKPAGALGAMFKKQETSAAAKKTSKQEQDGKTKETLAKKQEPNKKSPDTEKEMKKSSKKGLTNFLTKKDESKPSVIKPQTPKKVTSFFQKALAEKTVKEEPPAANVSVNLFEESASSSDDEETLDAIKRQVFADEEEAKPSTSNKRRRIVDSEDEDSGPEVKVDRKEEVAPEPVVIEDDEPKASQTFMDEDGFIVTVKAKNKRPAPAKKPAPSPLKIKKESPKSPSVKKATTPVAKKKQGNIMNFFTKK